MKNPELLAKTLKILKEAYEQDHLSRGSCEACAVGNLVASNCGIKFNKHQGWENRNSYWHQVFSTSDLVQRLDLSEYKGEAKRQIDSTGYTVEELSQIEFAFETGKNESFEQRKQRLKDYLKQKEQEKGHFYFTQSYRRREREPERIRFLPPQGIGEYSSPVVWRDRRPIGTIERSSNDYRVFEREYFQSPYEDVFKPTDSERTRAALNSVVEVLMDIHEVEPECRNYKLV